MIATINCPDLKSWSTDGKEFQLIDVREVHEREICHIGGLHVPMGDIGQYISQIRNDIPVVVYCHHGQRSLYVCTILATQAGFTNLYNLEGGIDAWARMVDARVALY
ncbi:MAG: hypothetical protein RIS47_859 [Bacteroidota bacterium]|jgi:rhodanese-related sulfurtransferase